MLRKLLYKVGLDYYSLVGRVVRKLAPPKTSKKKEILKHLNPEMDYEPHRRFRWIFELDDIPCYVIKSCNLPYYDLSSLSDSNSRSPYIHLSMYCPITPSVTKIMYDWAKSNEPKQAKIKLLSCIGEAVEEWHLSDVTLFDISFGSLDYSSSKPIEIVCSLTYKKCELVVK